MRTRTIAVAAAVTGLVVAGSSPLAQQPRFEAASVKRNTSGERGLSSPRFAGVTFTAVNVPVEMLISTAYGVPSRDLVDGPDWIRLVITGGERYDVVAKAAEGSSLQDQRAMLRNMLEDRFALRLRRESRQLPLYVLTKLNPQGQLGPNLRPAVKDCLPQRTVCEGSMTAGHFSYKGAQWSAVADVIRSAVGERMVDRTDLSGTFDVELTYNAKGLSATPGDSGMDILGAVRQQLGLKLEPGRAPFEVTVVEAVKRPTPD